jgi:hypothetical protein
VEGSELTSIEHLSLTWWCTPVIPLIQETEVGRSKFKTSLGKVSTRCYLKKKKSQRTRVCLASMRPLS